MNDNNNSTKPIIENSISKKSGGVDIVSLVFGIVSILCFWTIFFSFIIGLIGIICGIIGVIKKNSNLKFSIAGIITSIFGLLGSVIFFILSVLNYF